MSIDLTRGPFAQRSHGFATAEDATVKTEQPLARTFEMVSNNNSAACAALAAEILADNKNVGKILEVDVEGITHCDWTALATSPPVYTVYLTGFTPASGLVMRVIDAVIDPNSQTTKLLLKGSY